MKKTSEKWRELAERSLEPGDHVTSTWYAQYNRQKGYLVLSERGIIFIEEKGLFSKTVNLILKLPYAKISKVDTEGDQALILSEDGIGHHLQITYREQMANLTSSLDELMTQAKGAASSQIAT